MITINLADQGSDAVRLLMRRVAGAPEEPELKTFVGGEVASLVKQHLHDRDARPNRLGGQKTHFYARAGDSVSWLPSPDGVVVTVHEEGIRQRLEGGYITRKNAKALTIPISPRAHGKRAREFDDLFKLPSTKGDPDTVGILTREDGSGGIEPMFALRTRVRQDPDPTVMPDKPLIVQTASAAVLEFSAKLFNG